MNSDSKIGAQGGHSQHALVRPIGGTELTIPDAEVAMRKAMDIIQAVGTTGVHDKQRARNEWMSKYFPLYDL